MKVFVTGVAGQLGHDVMNDLAARGYEGIGTDIAPQYSGADDGTSVTKMPYVSLDITDRDAVEKTITELKPDVVVHCAAWTAVDLAEDDDKKSKGACNQRRRYTEYSRCLQEDRCQDGIYQHRLCI